MVVDRLLVRPGVEKRLEASLETATKLAGGVVLVAVVNGEERLYSQKMACPQCGTSVPVLEPRSFSFNSPYGACEACGGLGSKWTFDPAKVIADGSKPLLEGGLGPGAGSAYMTHMLQEGARRVRVITCRVKLMPKYFTLANSKVATPVSPINLASTTPGILLRW